jgi:hypothetical protein
MVAKFYQDHKYTVHAPKLVMHIICAVIHTSNSSIDSTVAIGAVGNHHGTAAGKIALSTTAPKVGQYRLASL